jgi:hypothetical protein
MNAEATFIADDWFGGPAFHGELTVLRDEDGNFGTARPRFT